MLNALDVAIGFATVMLAVSLIIMALTQAVASLLALRGSRLRLGLEQLLTQAVPALKDSAKAISLAMVTHPLISDSAVGGRLRWNWASTIRREELIPVLTQVLQAEGLPPLVEAQKAALEQWFDAFMRRVSQWFTMNTRWITVALAFVIALGMHLDSVRVIRQLETDSETRARLAAMSASLLDQTPQAITALETAIRQAVATGYTANQTQFATAFPNGLTADDLKDVTSDATARAWIATHAKPEAVGDLQQKLTSALQDTLAPR